MAAIGVGTSPALEVVEGDILHSRLGIHEGYMRDRISLVIHCAASTCFHDSSAELTHQTNVEGLRRVLEFAREHQAAMVHISTAYVAGRRTGRVRENELCEGQAFNNVYESTKCLGESLVHEWSRSTGLPATILRPSIVLGDWHQGRALRFNTLYDLMHAFDLLGPIIREQELRVVAQPDVTKNILPVDYFADIAWRIIQRGHAGTFHVVHPQPTSVAELREIFVELFGCNGARLVSEAEFAGRPASQAERTCHRAMSIYRPYMTRSEPVFDRSETDNAIAVNPPAVPVLDLAYFQRLLKYARQVDWGRRPVQRSMIVRPAVAADEYFESFLASKLGQHLLPNLHRLSSRFGIALLETPRQHWSLEIRQGVLHGISRGGVDIQCCFKLDGPTFMEIVAGRLGPRRAFFDKRIQIEGDLETGLKLATVLDPFFRKYPFAPSLTESCLA